MHRLAWFKSGNETTLFFGSHASDSAQPELEARTHQAERENPSLGSKEGAGVFDSECTALSCRPRTHTHRGQNVRVQRAESS